MNFDFLTQSELITDLGWTLLHSLWQICLVAVGLSVVLGVLRNSTPHVRYVVCLVALAISIALPIVTFVRIATRPDTVIGISDQVLRPGHEYEPQPSSSADASSLGTRETTIARATSAVGSLPATVSAWFGRIVPDLAPLAVVFWLLGVAFFSLRLVGGLTHLRSYRNQGAAEVDPRWQQLCASLCNSIGVTSTVRIVRSDYATTPIVVGILKPAILIPAGLFLQISPGELETIIAHELIHIRRYDPFVNLIQCLIETVFFYHPAVWWISRQIRREREFAADAMVIAIFDASHVTYARALANLEEIRLRTDDQLTRYATAANGGNFMQRIERILKIKTEASTANSAWTAGLAFLLTSAFLLGVFSFSSSELVNAQSVTGGRRLAIGFVSIPPLDRTANAPKDSDATARLLIQKLKEYKVPATGFLQGGMVSDGEKFLPVRANIARLWIDAGFEVGIGGFKHIGLYDTPAEEYIANIEKSEKVTKQLLGDMALPPRYFSYPYLNTGKTVEDRAKVEAWLASRGYTPVKYTFDNQEWMYSYAYDMARNDNDLNTMKEVREAYLDYMGKMFDHYEAYSQEMFGRDIAQTMVLTPGRLITDTADEFFSMATKRGYTFVSIDEAQRDPAYKTKEDFTGKAGISWFERWTMAKGGKLRPEPGIDPVVQKIWDERQLKAKK